MTRSIVRRGIFAAVLALTTLGASYDTAAAQEGDARDAEQYGHQGKVIVRTHKRHGAGLSQGRPAVVSCRRVRRRNAGSRK